MYTIKLPLFVIIPRVTKEDVCFELNLNVYRNTHYTTLNQAKKLFTRQIAPLIEHLPHMEHGVSITYILYPAHKKVDLRNFTTVVDKFFSDALVELGKIPDDSIKFIKAVDDRFGNVDKSNPRIEAHITPNEASEFLKPITPRQTPKDEDEMKIQISQTEIENAIIAHVVQKVLPSATVEANDFGFEFKMARAENGLTAEVEVVDKGTLPVKEPKVYKPRGRRKAVKAEDGTPVAAPASTATPTAPAAETVAAAPVAASTTTEAAVASGAPKSLFT